MRYRSYNLDTGDLFADLPDECSKEHVTRWAVREATSEEVARMKRDIANIVEEQVTRAYIRDLLNAIPDEVLIAEVRRRGLTVE